MKRILLIAAITVAVVFGVLLIVSQFLPGKYHVERSVVINAPAEKVYTEITRLKNWEHWSPWTEKDPKMVTTYSPADGAVESYMAWTSDINGIGKLTITNLVPNEHMDYNLKFDDWDATKGFFHISPEGEGVKVTWGDEGELKDWTSRLFGPLLDGMIGPDFEKGLNYLKAVSEGGTAQRPAPEPAK